MEKLLYDEFKLVNKHHLNFEDQKTLSLLYLPLMGIDSYATYSILMSLDDNGNYTFKKILDLLNFRNIKVLDKALEKLQALGLLRAYYNKKRGFLYELIPPLSFEEFFNNELLVEYLKSQIGVVEVKDIIKAHDTKIVGFKNVTKKFNEVFETTTKTVKTSIDKIFKDNIVVHDSGFNYPLFKILFDDSVINQDALDDEEFKLRIQRIAYIYKLNEEEMKDVVVKTIDIDKNLEYASISKNARYVFQNKFKVDRPKLATTHDDDFISSLSDDETKQILNLVDNMSFTDLLASMSGIKPAASEIKIFEDLMNNTNLSMGAINMMILHVSREKEGVLPGYNYFEKIANTWARAKVENAYDALKYMQKNDAGKQKTQKPYYAKKKRVVPLPDWYDEYTKELDKVEVKEVASENKDDLIEIVKEMLG